MAMESPAPPTATVAVEVTPKELEVARILESLHQLSEDASVPRNVRRGALSAHQELSKARTALDLRVASAVYVLDDLSNDPNLPTHGRTAIWSIVSSLESLQ